jgi:hypothetical protein
LIDEKYSVSQVVYPVELLFPNVDSRLPQQEEQSGVLRLCAREFNVATTFGTGDLRREDGCCSVRPRLERICVECRRITQYSELKSPVQIMEHEAGSETHRTPVVEMAVDPHGLFRKLAATPIKFAIVVQVMNAHLETVLREVPTAVLAGRCNRLQEWN